MVALKTAMAVMLSKMMMAVAEFNEIMATAALVMMAAMALMIMVRMETDVPMTMLGSPR